MTPTLSPRARSEYVATVLPTSSHRPAPRHAARQQGPVGRAVGAVRLATARLGWWHASVGRLAVIRRVDGQFVVSVDAGTQEHATHLLTLVREQLATMTVPQFEKAWGIDRVAGIPAVRSLPSVG